MGKFFREVSDELTLVVQQIAWLNAVPIDKAKSLASKQKSLKRQELMEEAGENATLPPTCAPFMVSYLLEIGPTISTGMGPVDISWRDIKAWKSCTGIDLAPWQARMLVQLSREYLSFSKKAEEQDCPAPWSDEIINDGRRDAVARSLRIGFAALMSMPQVVKKKGRVT